MIRHESITVSGTVLYCDECGARGPESAYDNVQDTMDQAEFMGWGVVSSTKEDRDFCPECLKAREES